MHDLLVYGGLALAGLLLILLLRGRIHVRRRSSPITPLEPGLGWREHYIGGTPLTEAAFIKLAVKHINLVQRRNKRAAKSSKCDRAFHAKQLAGIANAELRINADLPETLQAGYWKPGAVWPAKIRFSNASGKIQSDKDKDLRGAAVRVTADDGVHDLLMTNASASHARDAKQFIIFALAAAGGKLLMVPRLIWGIGLFEAIRMLRTVIKQASRPVESLATETFWSRAPYKCGQRALHFMIMPTQSGDSLIPSGYDRLSRDFAARLKQGPVIYDLVVQLFVNEDVTPIEDGVAEWKESDSRPIVIGQLVIPQQDLSTAEAKAQAEAIDKDVDFNPWNTDVENFRPLGGLNRARNPVYRSSVDLRRGKASQGSGCPFHRFFKRSGPGSDTQEVTADPAHGAKPEAGGKPADGSHQEGASIPPTPPRGNLNQPGPQYTPENGKWRPRSNRVGIGPVTYVWWNWFYAVMEFFNRRLSFNPYRKVSWDKWTKWFGLWLGTRLGLLYMIAKLRYNRSNALTDPYAYASNDNDPPGEQDPGMRCPIGADGRWVSDDKNGQMGAAMTRFGSNIPPRKVRPDVDKMTPSARTVSRRLRMRITDVEGNVVEIPALILNRGASGWIQFQFHGFGGNTLRDPINADPWRIPRDPSEGWPNDTALIDRTTVDPTRVTYDGRPTPINEKVHAWVQGQLYGNNIDEQKRLRSFVDGKLLLDEDGFLLEDPSRPGVDLTGMNNNWNPELSFLHWLFTVEHNAICDYLKAFHSDWTDDQIFQLARKTNCAQIARIHTIEWTEDLLQHPTLQLAMHADWYGLLGQRLKMWLMRVSYRHPFINWLLTPLRNKDVIWGMAGWSWTHHDGPMQAPKQFRVVYRLHEMVLDRLDIVDPRTGALLDRVSLIDAIHHNTRPLVKKFGYETIAWSFLSKSCGALKLHNFPRTLTEFKRMQDENLIDLAELDIFREREDGTGSYNDLRRSLGEPPVTSFMELTGGDAELARELEIVYEGDVDTVDAGIGILCEPKPEGFALGFVQFYQFVLNAPRRVKSNRFLSVGYTYLEYLQGMDWVEHGGGFKGVLRRHLAIMREKLEGVKRGFSPFPDVEKFPERLLDESKNDTGHAFLSDLRTIALAGIAGGAAVWNGLTTLTLVLCVLGVVFAGSVTAAVTRMLARRFMQKCAENCYTDKRGFFFGTLYRAEGWIRRASLGGSLGSLAMMAGALWCAVSTWGAHPWISVLFALAALSSLGTRSWSSAFTHNASILKVALRKRMRAGNAQEDASKWNTNPVDEAAVNRLFLNYAPGRTYLTEYDCARMAELERVRARAEGRGNWLTRLIQSCRMYRRHVQWINLYADEVVDEDRKFVPALTREMYVRVLQGVAGIDLEREMSEGDRDPSPIV